MRVLKGKLMEGCNVNTNDFSYNKDQEVEVVKMSNFPHHYGIYHSLPQCNVMDWIPKSIVSIIGEVLE